MSVSYKLSIGCIKPRDEKFENMQIILKACRNIKVEPPIEVLEYFGVVESGDIKLSEYGVLQECNRIWIEDKNIINSTVPFLIPFLNTDGDKWENGFYIDLDKLPLDVKLIRVAGEIS